jgi:hypothetical protein
MKYTHKIHFYEDRKKSNIYVLKIEIHPIDAFH